MAHDKDFNYQDFRDSFLSILQGMLHHNGLNMASEDHFRTLSGNAVDLALAAEKAIRPYRPRPSTKAQQEAK